MSPNLLLQVVQSSYRAENQNGIIIEMLFRV